MRARFIPSSCHYNCPTYSTNFNYDVLKSQSTRRNWSRSDRGTINDDDDDSQSVETIIIKRAAEKRVLCSHPELVMRFSRQTDCRRVPNYTIQSSFQPWSDDVISNTCTRLHVCHKISRERKEEEEVCCIPAKLIIDLCPQIHSFHSFDMSNGALPERNPLAAKTVQITQTN